MKITLFNTSILATALTMVFSSCKKNDHTPTPVEEELITTLKLNVTSNGFAKSFVYKIENGFGNTTPGSVQIDTIKLSPDSTYTVSLEVLNEKEDPAEDITAEIIEEKDEHLFLFSSLPLSGNGSIMAINGSKDGNNEPFNQTIHFKTGTSGNGTLTINLMHQPTDKNGTTPNTSGGSTDLEALFPVRIQ